MNFRLPEWLSYEIKRWWEQVAIRKWINNNPRLIIGITAASVFIMLVIVISYLLPGESIEVEVYEKGWFYDLNTGELFLSKAELAGPIEAPSGPLPDGKLAGVKAYVFSYAREPNKSNRFIGFLEIPESEATKDKSVSLEQASSGTGEWGQGKLIRRVEDKKWWPVSSKEGQVILNEAFAPNEDGQRPVYCQPK